MFYVVTKGRNTQPRIVTTWLECARLTGGIKDSAYRQFQNKSDATRYLEIYEARNGNIPQAVLQKTFRSLSIPVAAKDKPSLTALEVIIKTYLTIMNIPHDHKYIYNGDLVFTFAIFNSEIRLIGFIDALEPGHDQSFYEEFIKKRKAYCQSRKLHYVPLQANQTHVISRTLIKELVPHMHDI